MARCAGTDRSRIARGLASLVAAGAWDPRPTWLRECAGERRANRYRSPARCAPGPRLTPGLPPYPESSEPWPTVAALGLGQPRSGGHHHGSGGAISQKDLVALLEAPSPCGAGNLTAFGGPAPALCPSSQHRLGELHGARPAPRQRPARPAGLWERAAGRVHSRIDKQGAVALLPRAASCSCRSRKGPALRTYLAPRPSTQCCRRNAAYLAVSCPVGRPPVGCGHWPDCPGVHWNWWNPARRPASLWLGSEGLVASAASRQLVRAGPGRC